MRAWYERYLQRRNELGIRLPVPPLGEFRDWLLHLNEPNPITVMARTGMTLSDLLFFRRTQDAYPLLLQVLTAATRPVPDERLARFYRRFLTRDRFTPDPAYAQVFDEPSSAIVRAQLLRERTPLPLVRVLVLGNADFIGVLLSYLGCQFVYVLDIDVRVLQYSALATDRAGVCLEHEQHDLADGLPHHLKGRFDVVVADPPATEKGGLLFIRAARAALAPMAGGLLQIAVTRTWLGLKGLCRVQRGMAAEGFAIVEQRPGLLETRLRASVQVNSNRKDPIGNAPAVFSDVWLCRQYGAGWYP